jgi:ribosome maturation factor RimP
VASYEVHFLIYIRRILMIEQRVRDLLEEEVAKMGIVIDSVTYEKEGSNYFLRIVIDRDKIIDIDTCVEVTKVINPLLDDANIIEDAYILDISSKEKGEL